MMSTPCKHENGLAVTQRHRKYQRRNGVSQLIRLKIPFEQLTAKVDGLDQTPSCIRAQNVHLTLLPVSFMTLGEA
jgi:hypothetical protein